MEGKERSGVNSSGQRMRAQGDRQMQEEGEGGEAKQHRLQVFLESKSPAAEFL